MITYPFEELREALVDDRLDDLAVDIGEPDAHERAHDQKPCQQVNIACLTACSTGTHDFSEFADAIPKYPIDVASTFLICTSALFFENKKHRDVRWVRRRVIVCL